MREDPAWDGLDWSAGTFDGLRRAQQRDIAALTPEQRLEWLGGALDLALSTGALARARAARQAEVDEGWGR